MWHSAMNTPQKCVWAPPSATVATLLLCTAASPAAATLLFIAAGRAPLSPATISLACLLSLCALVITGVVLRPALMMARVVTLWLERHGVAVPADPVLRPKVVLQAL